jgi:hypothetical protein
VNPFSQNRSVANTEDELQKQMQAVRSFSDDIHTEFGLEKCERLYSREEN